MSERDDTRDTRDNTRESGSMFDPRAERAGTIVKIKVCQ